MFSCDDFDLSLQAQRKCQKDGGEKKEHQTKAQNLQDVLTLTDANKWYSVELQNEVIK